MLLTKKQIKKLSQKEKEILLNVLYSIEDTLDYNCKKISSTINYIQNNLFDKGVK